MEFNKPFSETKLKKKMESNTTFSEQSSKIGFHKANENTGRIALHEDIQCRFHRECILMPKYIDFHEVFR